MKRLICNKLTRCQPTRLRKKSLSHIILHVFCLNFLRTHHNYFFQRGFETVRAKFLLGNHSHRKYKQNLVLLVIYLFDYNSSKSTSFMMSVAFNFVLVRFSSSKLEFIAIQRLQKHSFFPACVFWYVVLFNEKLTVLHHEYNTFLFYFDICIKLTISATISTLEK